MGLGTVAAEETLGRRGLGVGGEKRLRLGCGEALGFPLTLTPRRGAIGTWRSGWPWRRHLQKGSGNSLVGHRPSGSCIIVLREESDARWCIHVSGWMTRKHGRHRFGSAMRRRRRVSGPSGSPPPGAAPSQHVSGSSQSTALSLPNAAAKATHPASSPRKARALF